MPEEYIPTEMSEQVTFVDWLETQKLTFTAVPSSTYTTSWQQKRKNWAMGVRRGCPDLLILLPGTGIAFVEMKRVKKGKVSFEQKAWIEEINKCPGAQGKVCRGAAEAIEFIQSLL